MAAMRLRTSADCLASVPRSSKKELRADQSSAAPAIAVAGVPAAAPLAGQHLGEPHARNTHALAEPGRCSAPLRRKVALGIACTQPETGWVSNARHGLRMPQQDGNAAITKVLKYPRLFAGGVFSGNARCHIECACQHDDQRQPPLA